LHWHILTTGDSSAIPGPLTRPLQDELVRPPQRAPDPFGGDHALPPAAQVKKQADTRRREKRGHDHSDIIHTLRS
jgi:hypothetical protein